MSDGPLVAHRGSPRAGAEPPKHALRVVDNVGALQGRASQSARQQHPLSEQVELRAPVCAVLHQLATATLLTEGKGIWHDPAGQRRCLAEAEERYDR